MLYKFEKDVVTSYYCIVEADSLEEAKEKAKDWDLWEEDYGGESDCVRYWGYVPYLEEGETCPTLEEIENDDRRVDEWDELDKDDDFFNNWHN